MSQQNAKTHKSRSSLPRQPDFCDYGTGVIAQRLNKMLDHAEGAKNGSDPEDIHQMRVWSRRTRAALAVFEACFAGKAADDFDDLTQEIKNVTHALGAARDLDVMMASLHTRADHLPPAQQAGIESFLSRLSSRRAAAQKEVARAVEHLENRKLKRAFQDLAEKQGYKPFKLKASDNGPATGK